MTTAARPISSGPRLPEVVPGVRRLGVLRANALGDFILAMPALEALRAAYPSAEVVLLGLPWHAVFLRGRPGPVDRVLPLPAFPQPSTPAGRTAFETARRAAREERFDLLVQMHGGGSESNPFVLRLGARVAVGLRTPESPALDRSAAYFYWQHEVLRWLEVASLAGARPVTLEPRVEVTAEDRREAGRVLPPSRRPLAVLHPSAGDPRRRWPAGRFRELAARLVAEDVGVAVIGTEPDRPSTTLVAEVPGAIDLCGRLSLGGLAGLLARADVLVANDSGPLHLARAVGAPTVGVYWCGNAITAGPLACARHRVALAWRTRCPRCGADCMGAGCEHDDTFVADVPAEEVLGHALDLLAGASQLGV